tara:strand:+ start:914 stop:1204 length:291 start_codon:yes stop_codon:yes gene_type:complete
MKRFLSFSLFTSVLFLSVSCRAIKSDKVLSTCSDGSETFKLTISGENISKVLINELEFYTGDYLAADEIYKESCAEIFEAPNDEPRYAPNYIPSFN